MRPSHLYTGSSYIGKRHIYIAMGPWIKYKMTFTTPGVYLIFDFINTNFCMMIPSKLIPAEVTGELNGTYQNLKGCQIIF